MSDTAMEKPAKKLTLNGLQKHLKGYIIGSLLTGIGLCIAFYYNTNYTLANHSIEIKSIDKKVTAVDDKVNNITSQPIRLQVQVNALENQVSEVNARLDNVNSRLDKMYEILLSIKNQ